MSYYQALSPDEFLPKDFFRGKVVIVGLSLQSAPAADAGGADSYATSFTLRSRHLVSGAEIQATIYENITKHLFIAAASPFLLARLHDRRGAACRRRGLARHRLEDGRAGRDGHRRCRSPAASCCCSSAGSTCRRSRRRSHSRRSRRRKARATMPPSGGCRRNITRAFSQYLSPVLVERLAADPARLRLGGERKTLSILFTDVRGFTTISEALKDEPERLTALMHRLLNPLSAAVLSAGGTIDKYIGDAIMAFWNAPLDDADHAVHAVEAALAMLQALDALNVELANEARAAGTKPLELRIGVGINTGGCIVGNMGSEFRFDYSALGDSVNLAARLESETKGYDVSILLGEQTAELAAAKFRWSSSIASASRARRCRRASSRWCRRPTPRRWPCTRPCSATSTRTGCRPRMCGSRRLPRNCRRSPATMGS